jgi:hypothetical protein
MLFGMAKIPLYRAAKRGEGPILPSESGREIGFPPPREWRYLFD